MSDNELEPSSLPTFDDVTETKPIELPSSPSGTEFLPPSMESLIPLPQEPVTEPRDTVPPEEAFEEEQPTYEERIEHMYQRVLPGVTARKLGIDPKHPWLTNPLIEKIVRATIEELFKLNVT
jgi:hypothetical protein